MRDFQQSAGRPSAAVHSDNAAAAAAAAATAGGAASGESFASEPLPLPGLLEGDDALRFSAAAAKPVKAAVKRILKWKRNTFPGGQPVSLSFQNMAGIASRV